MPFCSGIKVRSGSEIAGLVGHCCTTQAVFGDSRQPCNVIADCLLAHALLPRGASGADRERLGINRWGIPAPTLRPAPVAWSMFAACKHEANVCWVHTPCQQGANTMDVNAILDAAKKAQRLETDMALAAYVRGRGFLTLIGDVLLWLRWKFSGKVAGPHLEAMAA